MVKNFFTIAFRAVWKSKLFTAINISGLSIGISASLVIFLLVNHHFTFDQFEADRERIFRVVSNFNFSGGNPHRNLIICVCPPIAFALPWRMWDVVTPPASCL